MNHREFIQLFHHLLLQAAGRGDAGGDGRAGPVRGDALARPGQRRRRWRQRTHRIAHVRLRRCRRGTGEKGDDIKT